MTSSTSMPGKGAAEEPVPSTSSSSSSSSSTGAGSASDGVSKGKKGKKGTQKAAAAPGGETHRCFHCQSDAKPGMHPSDGLMRCSQCHIAWYCQQSCQKRHWKLHKPACVAAVAAEARRATRAREATAAARAGRSKNEMCVICIGPVVEPVEVSGPSVLRCAAPWIDLQVECLS